MSRIPLQTLDAAHHPDREVIVGWDRGLRTYFAQVFDGHDHTGGDIILLDIGNWFGEFTDPQDVIDIVRPYAAVGDDLHDQLVRDRDPQGPGHQAEPMPGLSDPGESPLPTAQSAPGLPGPDMTPENYLAAFASHGSDNTAAQTFTSLRRAVEWLEMNVAAGEPDDTIDVTITVRVPESAAAQRILTLDSSPAADTSAELAVLAELTRPMPEPTGMAWLDETRLDFLVEDYLATTIDDHDPQFVSRRLETRLRRDNIRDQIVDYLRYIGREHAENPTEAVDTIGQHLDFTANGEIHDQPPETWIDRLPRQLHDEYLRICATGLVTHINDPDNDARRIDISMKGVGDTPWHVVAMEVNEKPGFTTANRYDLGRYRNVDELTNALESRADDPIRIPDETKAELTEFQDRVVHLRELIDGGQRLRSTLRDDSSESRSRSSLRCSEALELGSGQDERRRGDAPVRTNRNATPEQQERRRRQRTLPPVQTQVRRHL
ncbi:hypothetical protein [Nocardia wallacei]|uniref:hypothetical protein n=1 Tax=Nocardia wallacei TaxID=480035 RepID=UPI002454A1AA|nr:hypothetical protein [Nocardia wallacei]